MNVVNISNLSCKIDDKIVIKDISLEIGNNSFVSVVGRNGCGKSTLVKILAGLVPYNGYVNINGYFVDKDNINKIRSGMAVVLDDLDREFMGETVFDDLIFSMENLRYSKKEIDNQVRYISELFNISDILDSEVKYITNSKRQILAIASSLVINPSILVLDDCLHQLSVKDKREVLNILKRYRKEKKITIIMVTNDMEDAMYSDRVIVINDGKVVRDGSVISVFKDRKLMDDNGLKIPFIIDLSLRLMDRGIINHIYTDKSKLCDDLWK